MGTIIFWLGVIMFVCSSIWWLYEIILNKKSRRYILANIFVASSAIIVNIGNLLIKANI